MKRKITLATSNSSTLAKVNIDSDTPGHPCGFYVLVELVEVEQTTESGLYVGDVRREQSAEECGYIRDIGPTAFEGWEGCNGNKAPPYICWGVEVGDLVEFRAYEGKRSTVPGFERWRYIPDSHIVGVVHHA